MDIAIGNDDDSAYNRIWGKGVPSLASTHCRHIR
jgi:hypothetical protein